VYIADPSILAGIAPCPAQTVIKQPKMLACGKLRNPLSAISRSAAELGRGHDGTINWLGIMRGDDPAGQGDIGEVLTIGVEGGIGRVGRT